MTQPFKPGDKVTTHFYEKDKHLVRTVTDCTVSPFRTETGWWVTAVDQYGRKLTCDAGWFQKVKYIGDSGQGLVDLEWMSLGSNKEDEG